MLTVPLTLSVTLSTTLPQEDSPRHAPATPLSPAQRIKSDRERRNTLTVDGLEAPQACLPNEATQARLPNEATQARLPDPNPKPFAPRFAPQGHQWFKKTYRTLTLTRL